MAYEASAVQKVLSARRASSEPMPLPLHISGLHRSRWRSIRAWIKIRTSLSFKRKHSRAEHSAIHIQSDRSSFIHVSGSCLEYFRSDMRLQPLAKTIKLLSFIHSWENENDVSEFMEVFRNRGALNKPSQFIPWTLHVVKRNKLVPECTFELFPNRRGSVSSDNRITPICSCSGGEGGSKGYLCGLIDLRSICPDLNQRDMPLQLVQLRLTTDWSFVPSKFSGFFSFTNDIMILPTKFSNVRVHHVGFSTLEPTSPQRGTGSTGSKCHVFCLLSKESLYRTFTSVFQTNRLLTVFVRTLHQART